jgi:hypothetical protein
MIKKCNHGDNVQYRMMYTTGHHSRIHAKVEMCTPLRYTISQSLPCYSANLNQFASDDHLLQIKTKHWNVRGTTDALVNRVNNLLDIYRCEKKKSN